MINNLEMLSFLCDHPHTTIAEIALKFGKDESTIRRDLDKLTDHHFSIDRKHGKVTFRAWSPLYNDTFHSVFLNPQQRELLQHLVQGLPDANAEKKFLLSKFKDPFCAPTVPRFHFDPETESKLRAIDYAMSQKKQVLIKQYSSKSGSLKTHTVEPVAWSDEYRQCAVFDVEKEKMITMVVGRMGSVTITGDDWHFERQHKPIPYDCFWMSGEVKEEVTLHLSQLALNLLHEDFPSSLEYKPKASDDAEHPFSVTLPIRQLEGCARFVMGMGTHCLVRQGARLQEYIYSELLQVHKYYYDQMMKKQVL